MRPTLRFLKLASAWTGVSVVAVALTQAYWLWVVAGIALLILVVIDTFSLPESSVFEVERTLPGRFALGVASAVQLVLRHNSRRSLAVDVHDGLPPDACTQQLPWHGLMPSGKRLELTYDVHFSQRGLHTFLPVHLLVESRFGLWRRLCRVGAAAETRVYPNYEPIVRFALLAVANREEQMGIAKRRRSGATLDFHQLREYQDGDVLSRVDWKATSRRQTLISRDYEEQRNQSILLVPDCGRRMRAMDGELSQFDHCLNAMLLISYIALRQGDEVGVVGFGGVQRWLKPVKGPPAMPRLLNHLYDYETTTEPSDFGEAAERVMGCQKRRALVILLTNLRTEDSRDLLSAVQVMQRRHLVLVATLKEAEIEERAANPVLSQQDALIYGALSNYLQQRQLLLGNLQARKILTLDETAADLPVALANKYLDIKASGKI